MSQKNEIKGLSAHAKREIRGIVAVIMFLVAIVLALAGFGVSEEAMLHRYLSWAGAAVAFILFILVLAKKIRCPKCQEGNIHKTGEKLIEKGDVKTTGWQKGLDGHQRNERYRMDTYEVTLTCDKCGYEEVYTEKRKVTMDKLEFK